ncbi:MAG: hypothetical protein HQ528_04870 [Candidatus Marinimicrobia bacterium]|nr:hypothetical protein [Candidatus Neomarinimicrobiota bacterium]
MGNNRWHQIVVLIILGTFGTIYGDDRLRLKQADILENITVDGQAIQLLQGNVIITKNDLIMNCDNARYNEKTGQGILIGNVKIIQEELTLTCDSLHHDSPNDLLMGFGNTHIWDSDFDLTCDTLNYFSELDSGMAMGNTRLEQEKQVITARRLNYHKAPEAEAASYSAEGLVTIAEEGRIATCGKAVYAFEDSLTILKIDPVVRDNGQILMGSEIELQYANDALKSIFIPTAAHVINPAAGFRETTSAVDDSTVVVNEPVEFDDDMTGNILHGYFTDGTVDSMRLEGMATTLYHIFEDSLYQGNNTASGDTIIMHFGDSELENIIIDGGARGEFKPDSASESIDAPIKYNSDLIDYNIASESTDLIGNASIDYTDMNLNAGYINVSWQNDLLKALPTLPGDTSSPELRPTINERGREPMYGDSLTYNLKNRHGRIIQGRTKTGGGYYSGQELRNVDNKTFYILHSSFTTCDLDIPHFHFGGKRMKMINQDKMVARPLILYIAGIPIFAVPLAILPHQGGQRHSGWIMPGYGENRYKGQFINGLGYFWAPNDYYDSKFLLDFYTNRSIHFRNYHRYKLRYRFNGAFTFKLVQTLPTGVKDISQILEPGSKTDLQLTLVHSQSMRHDQSLRINATYSSNKSYDLDNSIDPNKRLNQKANSNLTYNKRWRKHNNSLSMNLNSEQFLMAEKYIDPGSDFYQEPTAANQKQSISVSKLPAISFRHGQDHFFKSSGKTKRWYHNITWNYNGSLNNSIKTYYQSEVNPDSAGTYRWNPTVRTDADYGITHNGSLAGPQKIFRYINLNPSVSWKSNWVDRSYSITGLDSATNSIIKDEVSGFATRTTANMRLGLGTQIYGLFPVKIGGLQFIRHTISPTVSYNYSPDFSKPVFGHDFGYFQSITDTSGNQLLLDRFAGTKAGSSPKTESQSISFSMNNVFQAKLLKDEKEIKRELFSYKFSTGYNFKADKNKFSTISSSLRSKLSKKLSLDLNMTHDFYEYDEALNEKTDKIIVNKYGIPTPRLTRVSMSQSFSFSGKRLIPITLDADTLIDSTAFGEELPDEELPESPTEKPRQLEGDKLWNANFSFSYSLTNPQMPTENRRFQLNSGATIQMTKNWRIKYNANINLVNQQLIRHSISIYRDLHCWEMSINWVPSGWASGFYLKISPKDASLKDIKGELRSGRHVSGY